VNGASPSGPNAVVLVGDLTASRTGFGAMRTAGRDGWALSLADPVDPKLSLAVIRRAVELGANYIDTADSYGPEVSEYLIAEALRPYPKDLIVATKGGVVHPAPHLWMPDGRPAHLRRALEGSLRRLRLDTIDHYLLHKVDLSVPLEESVGALAALRDEGKIRYIGLCSVSVEQLRTARSITEIAAVQNRYSYLARESDPVLQLCEAEKIAFIPWEPLDRGALARGTGEIRAIADERGVPTSQIALAWLLRRSPNIILIPGTASISNLESNMASEAIALQEDEMARLDGQVLP
jgi:pyridoxine 4-dehydrogenase